MTARVVFLGMAVLAYATAAAATQPFTITADVVTAFPMAAAVAWCVWTWRTPQRQLRGPAASPVRVPSPDRAAVGTPARAAIREARWWPVWLALAVAVVTLELYCFVHVPRSAYPTLSSLLDAFDAARPGRAVAFAAWLFLGGYLVTR